MRKSTKDKARWVEYARGGTIGHTDIWVPVDNWVVFVELKMGVIFGSKLSFNVRPDQRGFMRDWERDRVAGGFLIGIAGTEDVLFLGGQAESCSGEILAERVSKQRGCMRIGRHEPDRIWDGLKFIASSMGMT